MSLSSFAYLYSEMVQYHQNRVDSISELERRLEATGYSVGLRVLELLAYRAREYKRETRLMNILQFVSTTVWKSLFGKAADSLERSIDHADEFMIVDYSPVTRYENVSTKVKSVGREDALRQGRLSEVMALTTKNGVWHFFILGSTFVSVPPDFGGLSVDAYISGIIAGILEGAGFPARVTAHSVALEDGESPASVSSVVGLPPRKEKTVFLVKFAPTVLSRDNAMG